MLRRQARRGVPTVLAALAVLLASLLVPGRAEAAGGVTYVGAAHSAPQAQLFKEATVPSGTAAGDTLLLVLTRASGVTWSGPSGLTGWSTVATTTSTTLTSTVYRRTAAAGDAGTRVRFDTTAFAKAMLTLTVYRGVDPARALTVAGSAETAASTTHPSPAVAASGGETAVSYWVDRSSTTTGWSAPATTTTRDTALGTGSGRYGAVLADRADVPAGSLPGPAATSTPATTALAWTVLLPAEDPGGPGNLPPTAAFTSDCSGLSCTVDGSTSSDPDGQVQDHAWDFGDGSTGTGALTSHTYDTAGSYVVRLTVTDDDLASASTTRTVTVTDAPSQRLLLGAASSSWPWFDPAIGPVDVYREFDSGFGYARWQDTPAYLAHPGARFEYSFRVLPQRLSNPTDPIVEQVRAFVATTPKDIILTVYHEPENYGAGKFDAAQYRAGLLALKRIVDAQDAADGGGRMVALILMNVTFKGMWTSAPADWWPTDARDGGHVDIVSADVYALPHATQTACCPAGYTDGVDWRRPEHLMSFVRDFAARNRTPWSVSEFGYLEDVGDPGRRSRVLQDAVAYARANGAHHVNVFDSKGDRADWRLRWGTPVGTASSTSTAARTWRDLVAQARSGG
ncbi:PKD domain-containing protein [Phycicoccus sonneratiae]|nr:PKD domain-containing protein [Phycicoccus sonneraticus]